MPLPDYDQLEIGTTLPAVAMPPITRQALAIYCGASGDHNPVHVDIDFAKESGLDDVIAHGMLIMAYSGRVLSQWVPPEAIIEFETRFMAMTHIGDAITASAEITEKFAVDGKRCVRLSVEARDQHGEVKTQGAAVVALA